MPKKYHKPEEIVSKLRQVDVLTSQGRPVADVYTSKTYSLYAARVFYYARIIEIPTPRWTAYDAKRFAVKPLPGCI